MALDEEWMSNSIQDSPGLTEEYVQHSICRGTFGYKKWSIAERKVACQKYESMTGVHIEVGHTLSSVIVVTIIIAVVVAGSLASFVAVNRIKSGKKKLLGRKRSKSKESKITGRKKR